MAEKDAGARLRRAVKDNNLFLVKRLVQRTDMRNTDPTFRRYTSLAWAAVLGNGETFEFLLNAGHDDAELSRDSDDNTVLALLADRKVQTTGSRNDDEDTASILRMARMYHDRYSETVPDLLNALNTEGKSALHLASLRGNEELVRMLCDWGADIDLPDGLGNTPLHYASAWGHIPVVQLLIERGCQYSARNNENYTASDYAYSFNTRDTLQDAARLRYENNKKSRRNIHATKANDWDAGLVTPKVPSPPIKARDIRQPHPRLRSGSAASRSTATSDSGEVDGRLHHPPVSTASSSPSVLSGLHTQYSSNHSSLANNYSGHSQSTLNVASVTPNVSPVIHRMRERDADAIEKYMRRTRSGSASTDNKSQNESSNFSSAGPSANGDDITSLNSIGKGTLGAQRRLRLSMSASQLRNTPEGSNSSPGELRHRAGTSPISMRALPRPLLSFSRSTSNNVRSEPRSEQVYPTTKNLYEEPDTYDKTTGPPSQYANFPPPPPELEADNSTPTISSRRLGFHLLSKGSFDSSNAGNDRSRHRRGSSSASIR